MMTKYSDTLYWSVVIFDPATDLDLVTHFDFLPNCASLQRVGHAYSSWHLVICPTLVLASVLMLRPIYPELVLFPDFWVSNTTRSVLLFCFRTNVYCKEEYSYPEALLTGMWTQTMLLTTIWLQTMLLTIVWLHTILLTTIWLQTMLLTIVWLHTILLTTIWLQTMLLTPCDFTSCCWPLSDFRSTLLLTIMWLQLDHAADHRLN